jgi:hypothetical protein
MKATVTFTNIPKRNQKFCKVLTKMVVVPDKRDNKTDNSKRFPTIQDPRPAILYDSNDSRPKASDSIASHDSNDSIRFKSHAQMFYPIQNNGDILTPTNFKLVGGSKID